MFRVDIVVQVANPIRPRLKIINGYVVIGQQRFNQRLFLLQIVFHLPLRVKLIPVRGGIRREEEHELRARVFLHERQKVVNQIEPGLFGKPRIRVALFHFAHAERDARQRGFFAVGV